MVAYYTIFGQKVGSHVLSMITLGSAFGGAWLAMGGGSKKEPGPPINAKSKEEESFVRDYLKKADSDDKQKQ